MKKYIAIGCFNIIDIIATLYLCYKEAFVEINPFIAFLLQYPILFVVVKIGLMTIVLVRLWNGREDKRVNIVINIGYYLYGILCLYYLICSICMFNIL